MDLLFDQECLLVCVRAGKCAHVSVWWTFVCMWACGQVCRWDTSPTCTCASVTIPSCLSHSHLCSVESGSWAKLPVRASYGISNLSTRRLRWDLPTDHGFWGSWVLWGSKKWVTAQASVLAPSVLAAQDWIGSGSLRLGISGSFLSKNEREGLGHFIIFF